MMLFFTNSILKALRLLVWALWTNIYRHGVGVTVFIWVLVGRMGMDVQGG